MGDLRQQHGDHTWDLVLEYCCCPCCKIVIEDRQKYENRNGQYQKDIVCPSCGEVFTNTKRIKPGITPLLGDPLKVS
jgi:rubredoxin